MAEVSLGIYTRGEATKNFQKFTRENETGRTETEYVSLAKDEELGKPQTIEVVARTTE